jgi:hypothetical protein
MGLTLRALLSQIAGLTMDCPLRSQEQARKAATVLLEGGDVSTANVG